MALNTYDPAIMMACAKTKARCDNSSLKSGDTGWRWNAEKYGHYMVRGGREWQWTSYSYKQLHHHQLKALKTWELGKAFFLGTAKGTKNPTYRKPIKFQCTVKLQTNENEPGMKCGGSPLSDSKGRKKIPTSLCFPWQRRGRNVQYHYHNPPGTWRACWQLAYTITTHPKLKPTTLGTTHPVVIEVERNTKERGRQEEGCL